MIQGFVVCPACGRYCPFVALPVVPSEVVVPCPRGCGAVTVELAAIGRGAELAAVRWEPAAQIAAAVAAEDREAAERVPLTEAERATAARLLASVEEG